MGSRWSPELESSGLGGPRGTPRPPPELERTPRPSPELECSGLGGPRGTPRYNGVREEFERRLRSLETRLGGLAKLLYLGGRATGRGPRPCGRTQAAACEDLRRRLRSLETRVGGIRARSLGLEPRSLGLGPRRDRVGSSREPSPRSTEGEGGPSRDESPEDPREEGPEENGAREDSGNGPEDGIRTGLQRPGTQGTPEEIEDLESFLEEADLETDPTGPVVASGGPRVQDGTVSSPGGPEVQSDFEVRFSPRARGRRAQNGRPGRFPARRRLETASPPIGVETASPRLSRLGAGRQSELERALASRSARSRGRTSANCRIRR